MVNTWRFFWKVASLERAWIYHTPLHTPDPRHPFHLAGAGLYFLVINQ